jgi:negative regulator of replication initiation
LDKDSMVILAIRRDWKPEDEDCTRKKMYVKYPYVPGPGFYGTGLANILGNSTAAMTAAWRISLDSGMFANFPAFLMDKLAGRQNTSNIRLAPGEAALVETGGRPIGDVVADLPFRDVTPGLMQMIDKITEQAKAVGGAPDIPVGEGMQNIPVGTMLAHIEQATKVMAAAHKGQHRALDEELSLIADLFRENPEAFWKGNKSAKGYWNVQKLMQALDERTLVPKSDPNVPSHIHRVMKAVALVELKASPLGGRLDDDEVLRRVLSAMREDPTGLILPKPPSQGPSPEALTAQAKVKEADAKMLAAQVNAEENKTKPELERLKTEGSIKGKTIDLAKTLITHQGDREDAAHGRQVDVAKLALDAKGHALETTKVAADAMKTRQEAQQGQQEHGLAAAQTMHKMGLETRQHGLAEAQAQHQMAKEAAEHGLATAELGHQVGMDHKDRDLAERELGVKASTEAEKIGVQKQHADTQRHVALHPPKPVGGTKKPKGKK